MWIWNHPNWPNYSYDASAFAERVEVFYRTAERIAGQVEALSSSNQKNAVVDLMLSEAITTSAIEGENLDRGSVRSSLLNLIGHEAVSPGSDDKAAGAAALICRCSSKLGSALEPCNAWPVAIYGRGRTVHQ